MSKFFWLLLTAFFLLPFDTANAYAEKNYDWLDEPVTLRFQNESLRTVLEKISKKTGISILFAQDLADEKVTGNYQNVKASEAVTRLFSSKNKSIQINSDKKIIIVKTFGAKEFIWANAGDQSHKGKDGQKNLTSAELVKLHKQQYKEYKDSISNENELIGHGITRGELQIIHEQQYAEFQASINNLDEKLEGGITRGELKAKQEAQYRQYLSDLSNDSEKLEGGITRGELRSMQEKQYKDFRRQIADDNEMLEGGMTRGELRIMHEKQYKEFKASLVN
jgi:type II secretory pathway component GspD/PulD (secretin)